MKTSGIILYGPFTLSVNAAMTLAILLLLKTMELLQNGLFLIRAVSLATSQH